MTTEQIMCVYKSIASAIVVLGWLVACGKDDGANTASSDGGARQSGGNGGSAQGTPSSNGASSTQIVGSGLILAELSAADAKSLCQRLAARMNRSDHTRLVAGRCAIRGITAAIDRGASCDSVAKDCVATAKVPPGIKQDCVPEDFPSCTGVTDSEYADCAVELIRAGADYYGYFTCNSGTSALGSEMQTPIACEQPFARCSAFAKASTEL
jgi:hypothetical protein